MSPGLKQLERRQIIIALTGQYGSGVTSVAEIIINQLKDFVRINPVLIKISGIFKRMNMSDELDKRNPLAIKAGQQSIGDKLRKMNLNAIGLFVLNEIYDKRKEIFRATSGFPQSSTDVCTDIYIVDSVKNPNDVNVLREIYGENFYLVSVIAPEDLRFSRLKTKNIKISEVELRKIDQIDYGEGNEWGQNVRTSIEQSDYFINNSVDGTNKLKEKVVRMLQVLFLDPYVGPTKEEYAMMIAWISSLRSMCLSRQVGASIMDGQGKIIGTGYNDPPMYGGGVYDSTLPDNSCCYNWSDGVCLNSKLKNEIIRNIELLERDQFIGDDESHNPSQNEDILNLLEFSRSVHAEMNAIMNLARSNEKIDENSKIFVTTFPCHHCARHIVCAGIRTVYFIEAYPKSRVNQLHHDSINDCSHHLKSQKKVNFVFYEGVAPSKYAQCFQMIGDRKKIPKEDRLFMSLISKLGYGIVIGEKYDIVIEEKGEKNEQIWDDKETFYINKEENKQILNLFPKQRD